MFTDELEITIEGGRGGDGKISFAPGRGGPNGGTGGRGGNVYLRASSRVATLNAYSSRKFIKAPDGGHGGSNKREGERGEDLYLDVPTGTTIIDVRRGWERELLQEGESILMCRGGVGGHGNDFFKSPTHQVSRKRELGERGEERQLKLIVKLIADFGLIGLPNAGKSSLLNELTAADVKTADYPFTTLEPALGAFDTKVIADIPGLIEGASKGKGLGIKFLRHIEKVGLLLHCIAADSDDVEKDYETVRRELREYSPLLAEKEELILLTKSDLARPDALKEKMDLLARHGRRLLTVSVLDNGNMRALKKLLLSS